MRPARRCAVAALALATALTAAACGGTAGEPTVDPAVALPEQPGLILAHPWNGERPDSSTIVLLGPDGSTAGTIELQGEADPGGRVLPDGNYLLTVDDWPVIVDTATQTARRVALTGDDADELGDLAPTALWWTGVSQAGHFVLLGNAQQSHLLLIDTDSGEATAVHTVLDSRFLTAASLDPDGRYVTVVDDTGVAVIATDDPQQVHRVLPDAGRAFGSIGRAGERYAVVVRDENNSADGDRGNDGVVYIGEPGQQPQPTDQRARTAVPMGERTLLIGGDGTVLLQPDGSTVDLGIGVVSGLSLITDSYFVARARGDDGAGGSDDDDDHGGSDRDETTFLVRFDDPAAPVQAPELVGTHPLLPVPPLSSSVVMMPNNPQRDADGVVVVDEQGPRPLSGVTAFDTRTAQPMPGDRLLVAALGSAEDPPATTVIDLASGEALLALPDRTPTAVAPDGSAVVVRGSGAPERATIVPVDGSDPLDLPGVVVFGWASAAPDR